MPAVYVANWDPSARASDRTVYQLLLPRRDDATLTWSWDELDVRESHMHGLGVYPRAGRAVPWERVREPVLMPYFGYETVVEDKHLHRCLVSVLHGDFSTVTVAELQANTGAPMHVRNGICAVPARADGVLRKGEVALAPTERLLQICDPEPSRADAGARAASYLLEADARELLGLGASGRHAHLFELLAAHQRGHHVDRHLATHLASIDRSATEGHVIVNAHPALGDGVNLIGMINEPGAGRKPSVRLVHRAVELLADGCPELSRRGLKQPKGADAAWRAAVVPHDARDPSAAGWRRAERMVLYMTTRAAYAEDDELTVDYGRAYRREYASGAHRPVRTPVRAPPDAFAPAAAPALGWPLAVPGWWNPHAQPLGRPAFRPARGGGVRLLDDDEALVAERKAYAASAGREARRESAPRAPLSPPRIHAKSRAAAAKAACAARDAARTPEAAQPAAQVASAAAAVAAVRLGEAPEAAARGAAGSDAAGEAEACLVTAAPPNAHAASPARTASARAARSSKQPLAHCNAAAASPRSAGRGGAAPTAEAARALGRAPASRAASPPASPTPRTMRISSSSPRSAEKERRGAAPSRGPAALLQLQRSRLPVQTRLSPSSPTPRQQRRAEGEAGEASEPRRARHASPARSPPPAVRSEQRAPGAAAARASPRLALAGVHNSAAHKEQATAASPGSGGSRRAAEAHPSTLPGCFPAAKKRRIDFAHPAELGRAAHKAK